MKQTNVHQTPLDNVNSSCSGNVAFFGAHCFPGLLQILNLKAHIFCSTYRALTVAHVMMQI